jgi:hypothetical protein
MYTRCFGKETHLRRCQIQVRMLSKQLHLCEGNKTPYAETQTTEYLVILFALRLLVLYWQTGYVAVNCAGKAPADVLAELDAEKLVLNGQVCTALFRKHLFSLWHGPTVCATTVCAKRTGAVASVVARRRRERLACVGRGIAS